jgi:hypothetical protein
VTASHTPAAPTPGAPLIRRCSSAREHAPGHGLGPSRGGSESGWGCSAGRLGCPRAASDRGGRGKASETLPPRRGHAYAQNHARTCCRD